jgi:hypothetical protein
MEVSSLTIKVVRETVVLLACGGKSELWIGRVAGGYGISM